MAYVSGKQGVNGSIKLPENNKSCDVTTTTTTLSSSPRAKEATELGELQKQLAAFKIQLAEREQQLNEREKQLEKREAQQATQLVRIEHQESVSNKSQKQLVEEAYQEFRNSIGNFDDLSEVGKAMMRRKMGQIVYMDHPITRRIEETKIAVEGFKKGIAEAGGMICIQKALIRGYLAKNPGSILPKLITREARSFRLDILDFMAHYALSPKFDVEYKSSLELKTEKDKRFNSFCKIIMDSICRDAKLQLSSVYPDYYGYLDGPYYHNQDAVSDFFKLVKMTLTGLVEKVSLPVVNQ